MTVSGISSSPLSSIAVGLRGQLKAQQLSTTLESAGMLDPNMAKSLDAMQVSAKSITKAAAEIAKTKLLGNLLNVLIPFLLAVLKITKADSGSAAG